MKNLLQSYRKNMVLQFLVSYVMILVVAFLIVGYGFRYSFRILEQEVQKTHIDMLGHSVDLIDGQLFLLEKLALQISQDGEILASADVKDGDTDYIMTAVTASNNFSMYLNSQNMELLDDAYIYFPNRNVVLYDGTFYRPDVFERYLKRWQVSVDEWRNQTLSLENRYPSYQRSGDSLEFRFPFSNYLTGPSQAVLVYRISSPKLKQLLNFEKSINQEMPEVMILNDDDQCIWESEAGAGEKIQEKWNRFSLEELKKNPFMVQGDKGIVLVQSERRGWNYVLTVSMEQVYGKLQSLKIRVILLLLLALISGGGYAILMAVKKGRPINEIVQSIASGGSENPEYQNLGTAVSRIVQKHQELIAELERDKPSIQTAFFHDLLQNEFGDGEEILLAAGKAGIALDFSSYQVAVFQLFVGNDIHAVDEQTLSEVQILSQHLENHMKETCRDGVWFYKRNYRTVLVFFAFQEEKEDILPVIQETRDWMLRESEVAVFWGIGNSYRDLIFTWRSAEEAQVAAEHASAMQPVVCYSSRFVNENERYLPVLAQDKLKECILAGRKKEMEELLNLLETENCVKRNLERSEFLKLSRALADLLGSVQPKDGIEKEDVFWLNEVLVMPEISQREYFERYRKICKKVCSENVENKRIQKGRLMDEILDYMQEHYMEADMGLTKVGNAYQISEGYLSAVFKEQVGVNFADFLENLRMERAYELLADPTLTVNQVADLVGYNSAQSFRRAFKRAKGINPKEVRKNV